MAEKRPLWESTDEESFACGDSKKRRRDGCKISPTEMMNNYFMTYVPVEDEIDLTKLGASNICETIAEFVMEDTANFTIQQELLSELWKSLATNKLIQEIQHIMPDSLKEFYEANRQHHATHNQLSLLSEINPSVRVKMELKKLLDKVYEKHKGLSKELQSFLVGIFQPYCRHVIGNKEKGTVYFGSDYECEAAKAMLYNIVKAVQFDVHYKGNMRYVLKHPKKQCEVVFKPGMVIEGPHPTNHSLVVPRIVAEVNGPLPSCESPVKASHSTWLFSTDDETDDNNCRNNTNQSNTSDCDETKTDSVAQEDVLLTKVLMSKRKLDLFNSCPASILKSLPAVNKLYLQHLGQLICVGENLYSTLLLSSPKHKEKLTILGFFVIGMKVYITKVVAPIEYWQSCVGYHYKEDFGKYNACFNVSNWCLNMSVKTNLLALMSVLDVYCSSQFNLPELN